MSERRRRSLIARRTEADSRLRSVNAELAALMSASTNSNADDEHDPEGATIGFERAQLTALAQLAAHTVRELDGALERLAQNTYGMCLDCGNDIDAERLRARPTAQLCIGCATQR